VSSRMERGLRSTPISRNMEDARPILSGLIRLFRKVYDSIAGKDFIRPEEKAVYDEESAGGILTCESLGRA